MTMPFLHKALILNGTPTPTCEVQRGTAEYGMLQSYVFHIPYVYLIFYEMI